MDLLTNISNRFNGWLSGVSRSSRVAIVLLLMLAVAVVLNNNGLSRKPQLEELLPGALLRRSEIQHICMALDANGLSEYKIENNVICVPSNQRSTYLKTVTENDLLPSGLQPERRNNTAMNPFITRAQQQQIQQEEKKRVIRELIRQLPFVEDACFEMDMQQSASAFEPAVRSALVSVEPKEQKCLNGQQIETLRNHISGALAGFSSRDIVITDLNAGRTYLPGQSVPGEEQGFAPGHSAAEVPAVVSDLERRIRNALSEFADLEIYVDVSEAELSSSTVPSLTASSRSTGQGVGSLHNDPQHSSMPRMQVGTNDAVAIGNDNVPGTELHRRTGKNVLVSVAVPQETVESHFDMEPVKTLFGFPLEEESPEVLNLNFEILKQDIITRVRTLLPPASFQQVGEYPIHVSLKRNKIRRAAPSQAVQLQQAFSDHWPTIAVVLIGCLMLTFVLRTGTSRRPHRPEQVAIEPPDSGETDGAAARQLKDEARQQLTQLIQDNPDKAAEVIKSWIRDAA